MLHSEWRCAACGCARDVAERLRAVALLPPLDEDALACSQRCALALVDREVAGAVTVIAVVRAAWAHEGVALAHMPAVSLTPLPCGKSTTSG
jgi:hypothetical protein